MSDDDADYAVPPCRVLCHDKVLNERLKSATTSLLKVMHGKSRDRVKKLRCIFLIENLSLGADTSSKESAVRVWLHHVADISVDAFKSSTTAGGSGSAAYSTAGSVRGSVRGGGMSLASEMKSVTTDVTHQSSSFKRVGKCHGDFCTYHEDDEYQHMRMGSSDPMGGGAVHQEVQKALGRHRRDKGLKKSSWKARMADLISTDVHDVEKEFQVDAARAEAVGMSVDTAGATSISELPTAADADALDDDMALPRAKQSGAHRVPNKTIALAREDMAALAEAGAVSKYAEWPEVLQHWFFRMGRSIVQKKVSKLKPVAVPISSGHLIGSTILTTPIETSVVTGDDDEALVSPSTKLDKKVQEAKSKVAVDLAGNIIVDESDSSVPFDLPGDQKAGGKVRRTVGQIATYYSETSVCAACYKVYCELDRRRDTTMKNQFKQRRQAMDDVENTDEHNREIERKIFMQRKFVSRLAKTQNKKASFMVGENGMSAMQANMNMSMSIMGGSMSLADPSWQGAHVGFGDNSMVSSMASRFPLQGPQGPTKGRAPKGALPPLPWQLKDASKRKEYVEGAGSNFVRNIASKAQEMQEVVKQERMLSDLQYRRDVKAAEKQGLPNGFDWEKMTGKAAQLRAEGLDGKVDDGDDSAQQRKKIRAIPKFDPMRLLHPHQRHLENLKNGMTPKEAERAADLPINRSNKGGYGSVKEGMHSSMERRERKMQSLKKAQRGGNRAALEPLNPDALKRTSSAGSAGLGSPSRRGEGGRLSSPQKDPLSALNKFSQLSGNTAAPSLPSRSAHAQPPYDDGDDDDDGDDYDDDDEEIGWSPFVVNLNE